MNHLDLSGAIFSVAIRVRGEQKPGPGYLRSKDIGKRELGSPAGAVKPGKLVATSSSR